MRASPPDTFLFVRFRLHYFLKRLLAFGLYRHDFLDLRLRVLLGLQLGNVVVKNVRRRPVRRSATEYLLQYFRCSYANLLDGWHLLVHQRGRVHHIAVHVNHLVRLDVQKTVVIALVDGLLHLFRSVVHAQHRVREEYGVHNIRGYKVLVVAKLRGILSGKSVEGEGPNQLHIAGDPSQQGESLKLTKTVAAGVHELLQTRDFLQFPLQLDQSHDVVLEERQIRNTDVLLAKIAEVQQGSDIFSRRPVRYFSQERLR